MAISSTAQPADKDRGQVRKALVSGYSVVVPSEQKPRFTGIIWGQVGAGKTPLAATAPAPILLIQFDQNGDQSIRHQSERYRLLDLSGAPDDILDMFEKLDSGFFNDLTHVIVEHGIKTIVLDSVTSLMDRALSRGIARAARMVTRGDKPTPIAPQLLGYGARSNITRYAVMNLHTLCARLEVNFIVTAHTKTETDKDGSVTAITMMLGGETYVQVPKAFSEVWMLLEHNSRRYIYTRNFNKYGPCRTRMFRTDKPTDYRFEWKFNPYEWRGEGIEDWAARRERANGPIAIPGT